MTDDANTPSVTAQFRKLMAEGTPVGLAQIPREVCDCSHEAVMLSIASVDTDWRALGAAYSFMETVLPDNWVMHRLGQLHGGLWLITLYQLGPDGWHDSNRDLYVTVSHPSAPRALILAALDARILLEGA